jgi:hypothetical protein
LSIDGLIATEPFVVPHHEEAALWPD